jgi:hypothetical protein
MARCWECEVEVNRIVDAVLPTPEGESPIIGLCQSCFESVYLALVGSLKERALADLPDRVAAGS